ncbi:uncharacterized protein LOC107494726 [Arachis duranensis]|uniref:Uncharacterized protein LOC107494726 n=1 Tax=Arachis duranensis TaxID=130453 RepID=A0A6P4DUL0_ARADU|nr:uncharacterized protein LOC107494726 [Arachis duranensis]XP_025703937.1 uncharacterized protein LOC112805822 [Arachis hypogaea]
MGATPFHPSILKVRLPKHFDKPTDMRYDGTQDPQEHLTAFEARMNLEGIGDAVRYRAFSVTLAGPAIWWFNALPQGFITTFSDITHSFLAQFTTHIAKAKHPINLLGVTQRAGEPTRKFLDRFNDECLEIDGLTDLVASLCLMNDLLNEDFRKNLTTKPVWTIQDIQNVAREYINDEEVRQVVVSNKRQQANPPPRQPGHEERSKEPSKDGGSAKPFKPFPRVGKFSNYTSLTAPIVEDCFDLKDALEKAIRDGKLTKFSQFIREPRQRGHERFKDDQDLAMKLRQGASEYVDNALTVVNIVVGRNAPLRSRSATKKDTRVLAVSSGSHRPPSRELPRISFGPEDQWFHDIPKNPLW